MASKRTDIRNAIKTGLDAFLADTIGVFANRVSPVNQSSLPQVLIYPESEPVQYLNMSNRNTKRQLFLNIQVVVEDKDEDLATDQMDDISEEIEKFFDTDDNDTLDGLVLNATLTDNQMKFRSDGDSIIGSQRMVFNIEYLRT